MPNYLEGALLAAYSDNRDLNVSEPLIIILQHLYCAIDLVNYSEAQREIITLALASCYYSALGF